MSLKEKYFQGGSNLTPGGRRGKDKLLSEILNLNGQILALESGPAPGGAALNTMPVTGLKATDTVLAVTPKVVPTTATAVPVGHAAPADGEIDVTYSADPVGVGTVLVLVSREL